MKVTFGGKICFEVNDIQDGIYHITFTYETIAFKLESAMISMNFNSEEKTNKYDPMHKALAAVVGVPYDVRMDRKGKVLSVTGFEKIYDNMVDSLQGNIDIAQQIVQGLKQQFGNDAVKANIEMMTSVFPDEVVGVGESWSKEMIQKSGMGLKSSNKLTLDSAKDGKWDLTGEATMVSDSTLINKMNGMNQQFMLKGTSTFKMELDAKTGWIVQSDIKQNIEGSVAVEGGKLPAPMEIPMRVVSEIKISNM